MRNPELSTESVEEAELKDWSVENLQKWDEKSCVDELESRRYHLLLFLHRKNVDKKDRDDVLILIKKIQDALQIVHSKRKLPILRSVLSVINLPFLEILDRK